MGEALGEVRERIAPATPLAAVQAAWGGVVGERIAAVTEVVAEREGTVTIETSDTVWAQELELMSSRLLVDLTAEMGELAPRELRFRAVT